MVKSHSFLTFSACDKPKTYFYISLHIAVTQRPTYIDVLDNLLHLSDLGSPLTLKDYLNSFKRDQLTDQRQCKLSS